MVGKLFLRTQRVHDALLDRGVVGIRRGVDEPGGRVLVDAAACGDRPDQLLVIRVEQPRHLLAKLGRHL